MSSKIKILVMVSLLVLSVLAFIPMGTSASPTSISYAPDIYSSGTTTTSVVNGGSFTSGSTVYFFISESSGISGIIGSYIGSYSIPAGYTTMSNAHIQFSIPNLPSGNYYLIASTASSPSGSSSYVISGPIKVTYLRPYISISSGQATQSVSVTGYGWDPSSTLSIYTTASGLPMDSNYIASLSTSSSGRINYGSSITIPSMPYGTYNLVIQETSTSSQNYGITFDTSFTVTPYISVSPYDISGISGSRITVSGYGFPSGAVIPAGGINVAGAKTTGSSVTANYQGSFSVSVSLLSTLTATGPQPVTVQYNSSSYTQSNAIVISYTSITSLGLFVMNGNYPGSQFTAFTYNFPSGNEVSYYIGNVYLGSVASDSNGFAEISGIIPAIPAGNYQFTATSSGMVATKAITLYSYYMVKDPSGGLVSSEYFPSGGIYTVQAYGLNPMSEYQFYDSGASSALGSSVISISSGNLETTNPLIFEPSLNGTLIFTFQSFYSDVTSATISLGTVSGLNGMSFGYKGINSPTFGLSPMSIFGEGKDITLTVSSIIPVGSIVYPGVMNSYNIYIGNTLIQFTTSTNYPSTDILSSQYTSQTVYFIAPTVAGGVYNLSLYYAGYLSSGPVSCEPVILSSASTSLSSGSITTVPVINDGQVTGYYVAGYDFYSGASVKIYYSSYIGENILYSTAPTYGAFETMFSVSSMPSGTYSIIAVATYGTATYTTYASYRIYSYLDLGQDYGGIGTTVSFTLYGLGENAYYSILFSGIKVATAETNGYGYSTGSFQVPAMVEGNYTVEAVSPGSSQAIASSPFTITMSSTLALNPENYAFPGQLIQFTWNPSVKPSSPSSSNTGLYYSPVFVTIYLNNSAYATVEAGYYSAVSNYLNGSFQMPNGNPGTYYTVTLSWTQYTYTTETISSSLTTVETATTHMMSPGNGAFIQLVSGNGAIITGISQSQIAQISASVNGSIKASLQLPISEMNASISSINSAVVTINTSFGKMETTLSAINSSIISINNGIASIQTSLGNVQVSLKNINASVMSANDGIVSLETSVGTIKTSLNNLQPEIAFMNGSIVKISTVAGMINYNLTQFSNIEIINIDGMNATVTGMIDGMNATMLSSLNSLDAKIVSVNGNEVKIETTLGTINGNITGISNGVATIQTNLGTMRTNVSAIQGNVHSNSNVSNNIYMLIMVIVILVIITLIVAVVAMMGVRDIAKRFGMKKE